MTGAKRFFTLIPILAAIVWLGSAAVKEGLADDLVDDAGKEMGTWLASRSPPGRETMAWVGADLNRAALLSPKDPKAQELLGALKLRSLDRPEYIDQAVVHYRSALAFRPTSPYTWANIAQAEYHRGNTAKDFEFALQRAAALGPAEPEVQRTVVNYGLAVWDEVTPSTRNAIAQMIREGGRRNALEMLQFGERRGRLGLVCSHLADSPRRADSTWHQLCPSTEATS
jgi:hypothetical protein